MCIITSIPTISNLHDPLDVEQMQRENEIDAYDRLLLQMACARNPRLNFLKKYLKASKLEHDLRLIQKREYISSDTLLCIDAILEDLRIKRNLIILRLIATEKSPD